MRQFRSSRSAFFLSLAIAVMLLGGAAGAVFGVCGPFTDVSDSSFCPFVLEIFTLGITTGTTPTTYGPADNVSRLQMAAFLSRSVDGVVKRVNRRAAMNQYWTPQGGANLGITTVGISALFTVFDGADVWITGSSSVARVRASDGKLLETWTGADGSSHVLSAMGRIFVTGANGPGDLYRIDPGKPAGVVTTVASNLGNGPNGITFDGSRLWTADFQGSVSIVTPGSGIPFSVTIVASGFSQPQGILYDGANVWVADAGPGTLLKLDGAGAVLQTVTVGSTPNGPVFDGANIWVPNFSSSSVSIVRASNGAVLATLTGNGLNGPTEASFDGQRVLVTDQSSNSVSLWKAADLTPLGTFSTGATTQPTGVCSDGLNFWITLQQAHSLARF